MEILCTPPISQILNHFTPPPIKNALTSKNNFNNETCSTNTFNHFNAMKNYNIAFLGIQAKKIKEKDESIYVIDAYGNFKKFNNPLEAAKAFNVNVASILKCAEGDSETVGDFVFAYADNVEETGRDGKKVPDKLIINLASEIVCSIAAGRTIPISIDDALEAKVKSKTKQISKSKKEPNSKTNERINASVYAIDKTGKYIKYEKVQDLLDSLDISKASVYKCLRKEKDNINGIVFCYDFEVETINEKGEIVPNNRLIKKQIRSLRKETSYATLDLLLLRKQQSANPDGKIPAKTISNCDPNSKLAKIEDEDLLNTQLRYLLKPFYAVDKDGNYRKFYLQKYVADALGIYKEKISDCLQKRIRSIKGYSFIYASEVESIDKEGNIVVDSDRLTGKTKSDIGFYLVDKNGNYKRFETVEEAHKSLNISYSNILSCILGRQDKTSEYFFIKASDIEIENEDGTISIDETKLQEAMDILNKSAVYLIDKDGKYKRYSTRTEAGNAIGVSLQDISAAAKGRKKTIHGYIVLNANEVEKISPDGTITVDEDKIQEAIKAAGEIRTIDVSVNGFYAIDKDRNYKKFFSITDARNELGIQYMRILNCLLKLENMANGYVFALGEEIDIKNEDGIPVPDLAKIEQKASYFEDKAIYAIAKDGRCQKYTSQKEASEVLGIPLVNISRCINKKIKETYGYSFLFAKEVEIGSDGDKTILDEDLIQEKIIYLNKDAIYVITKEGEYTRYEDRDTAEAASGVKKASIADCLKGKYKTSHGLIFAHPYEVETRQEDGTFKPDKKKIKEKIRLAA